MSVENKLNALADAMKEVPIHMRFFSLSMRSLYTDYAVGESTTTTRKINKIRDDTRGDALLYINGILPLTTELVGALKEFFEYYDELEIEDWKECLSDIVDEVTGYKQCCEAVIHLHEDIMVTLKKRESEANVLISELKNLTEVLKMEKEELERSASNKKLLAMLLSYIPGLNLLLIPLLEKSFETDLAKSVAHGAQCKINDSAVIAVGMVMIPALQVFIMGLNSICGFFEVVREELRTFQNKSEKAFMISAKKHYIMMKKKANDITQICSEFFLMLPGVRTDFRCIQQSGSDINYVEAWLEKQKEEIAKKYANSLTKELTNMLTYRTSNKGGKLMIEYGKVKTSAMTRQVQEERRSQTPHRTGQTTPIKQSPSGTQTK